VYGNSLSIGPRELGMPRCPIAPHLVDMGRSFSCKIQCIYLELVNRCACLSYLYAVYDIFMKLL
jgi:hypothetical protein